MITKIHALGVFKICRNSFFYVFDICFELLRYNMSHIFIICNVESGVKVEHVSKVDDF